MGGLIASISLANFYSTFLTSMPLWAQKFLNLFLISIVIVIYAVFIWKFYRWVAKKDILELNLNKYNKSKRKVFEKWFAGMFYSIEFLIILPLIVFVWFLGFTTFLMLLTENIGLNSVLIISATILAAIRMTSYYSEDLSKDLAKLLPFTLLGVSITQFGAFSFEHVIKQISAIPSFFHDIVGYLLFIILMEFLLRFLDILFINRKVPKADKEKISKKKN